MTSCHASTWLWVIPRPRWPLKDPDMTEHWLWDILSTVDTLLPIIWLWDIPSLGTRILCDITSLIEVKYAFWLIRFLADIFDQLHVDFGRCQNQMHQNWTSKQLQKLAYLFATTWSWDMMLSTMLSGLSVLLSKVDWWVVVVEFVIETSNDIEEGVSSGSLVTTADPVSLVAAGAKGTWKTGDIK